MAIQMRQGNEVDFDAEKMLPGEWAVSTDARIVRMCFAQGIVIRMATYEAFEADMEQIRDVLAEAKTTEEAIERIRDEIHDTEIMVENYALSAKSYAVGSTGVRDDEDTDNAKYYYDQAKRIAQGVNGIVPMGTITFEELPTEGIVNNAMYNISNAFTSDERFNDGGGVYYGAGNNVLWTANGKWDVTAASGVTGIKGENEIDYRQGNVNITRDNIGLGDDVFGTADISAIGDGTVKGAILEHDGKFLPLAGGTLSGHVNIQRTLIVSSGSDNASIRLLENPEVMSESDTLLQLLNNKFTTNKADKIRFTDNGTTFYKLFGEHNKPSGSYTGNGGTTIREIVIGGIYGVLSIQATNGLSAFINSCGAIYGIGTSLLYEGNVTLSNTTGGNLVINSKYDVFNATGVTYYYHAL